MDKLLPDPSIPQWKKNYIFDIVNWHVDIDELVHYTQDSEILAGVLPFGTTDVNQGPLDRAIKFLLRAQHTACLHVVMQHSDADEMVAALLNALLHFSSRKQVTMELVELCNRHINQLLVIYEADGINTATVKLVEQLRASKQAKLCESLFTPLLLSSIAQFQAWEIAKRAMLQERGSLVELVLN